MGNPPKSLNIIAKRGQLIYYDKLMLGCEEKILKECHLLPSSFPTRPATFTLSNSKCSYSTKITDNDKDILITKATFTQRQ